MDESSSRQLRLVREIDCELQQLERVAEVAAQISALGESERRPWDSAAAAKYVADLFLGLENLCKRRLRYLDLPVPGGPESHSEILKQFLADPDLGASLGDDVALRLKKYLRFRHRFSHGYGYEVAWETVEEPLKLLPETVTLLDSIWRNWVSRIGMSG